VLRPRYSRYVIDLNRPPDDTPMYPGASNTELCPTRFFSGVPLYQAGVSPLPQERSAPPRNLLAALPPALAAELARLKAQHGFVLLWDAHSIRAKFPGCSKASCPT
jgi:N-formylglutamate deformylase